MKTARKKMKQSFAILKKYELSFDIDIGKYYFAKIKKDKEGYILFLFFIIKNILNYKEEENIDKIIFDEYAYMNCETGKLEDISLIDVMRVKAKYFKQQQ
jgi:hypothetical protein